MEDPYKYLSQETTYMDLTPVDMDNDKQRQSYNKNQEEEPLRNFGQVGDLRSVKEIPKKFQHLFNFPFFNIIQSSMLDNVLYSDVPVVLSAPTGSGKTVIFELAIIRLLRQIEAADFSEEYKIVYVAPTKALCAERLIDWHQKFSQVGLSCIVVTGDSDNIECKNLKNHHIILTTPEKWNALTRYANEAKLFIQTIKLFMIDEVHLLNEETRGPTLEATVSRLKLLKGQASIRFMAVSATIPNIEDIAKWLSSEDEQAAFYKIGDSFRPVQLKKVVLGYPCSPKTSTFKFDLTLNYKLPAVLLQHSDGKPSMVFCSTRKGVEITSKHISQSLTFHLSADQKKYLEEASSTMLDNKMRLQLMNGVGVHHAGMTLENRSTIEQLFRKGLLPVLIATSTLAMGVNLPAHLVVIKSTQHYVNGGFQNYSESTLLQMIGRAGRPQYDTSATVVIMTKSSEKEYFEKMVGGTQLIESNLHRHLTQHLNAEIVLHIITDIAVALDWLRSTFLYVRVLKNPKHYNMPANLAKDKIEKKLQDLCQIEINALSRYGMLEIDQMDGFSVRPTSNGILMSNYYLALDTMKLFLAIKGSETLSDILNLVCNCSEFSEITLRVDEKRTLNTLNSAKYSNTIRFPLPGNIKTSSMKVNCIIQATFGCLKIQNPSLYQEAVKIMRTGERICKALVEYLLKKEKCFQALLNSLTLSQCFHAQLWENSAYVSKQLNKIGPVLSSMLASAGKTTFKVLLQTNPRDIERIINRSPPMGNDIQDAIAHLPFYRVELKAPEKSDYKVKVLVKLLNADSINLQCTVGRASHMVLLVGDSENNVLLCTKLHHNTMVLSKENSYSVDVVLLEDHVVHAHLLSENWVGIDCHERVDIIIKEKPIQNNYTRNRTVPEKQINKSNKSYKLAHSGNSNNKTAPKNTQNTILKYLTKTPSKSNVVANNSNDTKYLDGLIDEYIVNELLQNDNFTDFDSISDYNQTKFIPSTNKQVEKTYKPVSDNGTYKFVAPESKIYPFETESEGSKFTTNSTCQTETLKNNSVFKFRNQSGNTGLNNPNNTQNTILKYLTPSKRKVDVASSGDSKYMEEIIDEYTMNELLQNDENFTDFNPISVYNQTEFIPSAKADINKQVERIYKPVSDYNTYKFVAPESKIYPFETESEVSLLQVNSVNKSTENNTCLTEALKNNSIFKFRNKSEQTSLNNPNSTQNTISKYVTPSKSNVVVTTAHDSKYMDELVDEYTMNELLQNDEHFTDFDPISDHNQTEIIPSKNKQVEKTYKPVSDNSTYKFVAPESKICSYETENENSLLQVNSVNKFTENSICLTETLKNKSALKFCNNYDNTNLKKSNAYNDMTGTENDKCLFDDGNDLDMFNCVDKIETIGETNPKVLEPRENVVPISTNIVNGDDIKHSNVNIVNLLMPRTFKETIQARLQELKAKERWTNDFCDFEIGTEEFIMSAFEDNSDSDSTCENEEVKIRIPEDSTDKDLLNENKTISKQDVNVSPITKEDTNDCNNKHLNSNGSVSSPVLSPKNDVQSKIIALNSLFSLPQRVEQNISPKLNNRSCEYKNKSPQSSDYHHSNPSLHNLPRFGCDSSADSSKIFQPISESEKHDDTVLTISDSEPESTNKNIDNMGIRKTDNYNKSNQEIVDIKSPGCSKGDVQKKTILPREFYTNILNTNTLKECTNDSILMPSTNDMKIRIENALQNNKERFPSLNTTTMSRESINCDSNWNKLSKDRNILQDKNLERRYDDNKSGIFKETRNIYRQSQIPYTSYSISSFGNNSNNNRDSKSSDVSDNSPMLKRHFAPVDRTDKLNKTANTSTLNNDTSMQKTDIKKLINQFEFLKTPVKQIEPIDKKITTWKRPIKTISGHYKKRKEFQDYIDYGTLLRKKRNTVQEEPKFNGNIQCTSYSCYIENTNIPQEDNVKMSMLTIIEKEEQKLVEEPNVEKESMHTYQYNINYNLADDENDITFAPDLNMEELDKSKSEEIELSDKDVSILINNDKEKINEVVSMKNDILMRPIFSPPDFHYQPFNLKKLKFNFSAKEK